MTCKSEHPIEWSINQRILSNRPKLHATRPGLFVCRAKVDLHYSRVSYIKVIKNTKSMRKAPKTTVSTTTTTTKPQMPPEIQGRASVLYGQPIKLACIGDQSTDGYRWYMNGKILDSFDQILEKSVSSYDDIGNYTCSVSETGPLSKSFAVSVGKKPLVFFDVQSEMVRLYPDSAPFDLTCVSKFTQQDIQYNVETLEIKQWLVNEFQNSKKTFNTTTLRLEPPLAANETGKVTCYAESKFGVSKTVMLYEQKPYFISNIEVRNGGDRLGTGPKLILGDQRLLTCTAKGHPLPKISWQREASGLPLSLEKERTTFWSNGTLSVNEIQPLDSGVYICSATNAAGSLTERVTINIVEAPSLSLPPQPSPFSRNQNVRINCAPSKGSPPFRFEWSIQPASLDTNITTDTFDTNSILEIESLVENLNVTCKAINDAGFTSSTVQLLIGEKIEMKAIHGPTVTEGEKLELQCKSKSPVQWIINGLLINHSTEKIKLSNNRLIIEHIQQHNVGVYECTDGRSFARIDVNVVKVPVITIKYPGTLVRPGMPVTMSCHASGNPQPEVKFYKSGARFIDNEQSNTISIARMDAQNEGNYTCQAENAIGSVSETITIKIKSPWISPAYQEVFSGQRTELSCFSRNKDVIWRGPFTDSNENGPIIVQDERYSFDEEKLIIEKTYKSDTGRYSCSSQGNSHEAMVHVKSLPAQFIHAPLSFAKMPIPSSWYNKIELQFKFRTDDSSNGTLLYVGGSNNVDFFKIQLENELLIVEWNLGSGTGRVEGGPIADNKWYYVNVERDEKLCSLSVNGKKSRGQSPGAFTGFDYKPFGIVGGGTSNQPAFFGCLLDMYVNGNMIDFGMLDSIGLTTCKIKQR